MQPDPRAGAQLYTCRASCQDIDGFRTTLARLQAIGYTCVQLSGINWAMGVPAIARALQDHGMDCACTHMGWDDFLTRTDELLDMHAALDCRYPAIGGLPADYRSAEGLKRFIDELKPLAAACAQRGMRFSYHNHHMEFLRLPDGRLWLQALYEDTDSDTLCAELDTYWVQEGGGDPARWIRRLPGRQPLLHLKDRMITPEGQVRMAPIGEGVLDWYDILSAAREAGVEFALVEQDDCYGMDPVDALAISYRFLSTHGIR